MNFSMKTTLSPLSPPVTTKRAHTRHETYREHVSLMREGLSGDSGDSGDKADFIEFFRHHFRHHFGKW